MVLKLAKEYGQAPEDVEKWDEYWVLRAVEMMEGESLYHSAEKLEMDQKAKQR